MLCLFLFLLTDSTTITMLNLRKIKNSSLSTHMPFLELIAGVPFINAKDYRHNFFLFNSKPLEMSPHAGTKTTLKPSKVKSTKFWISDYCFLVGILG